jgi:hypothetical protein
MRTRRPFLWSLPLLLNACSGDSVPKRPLVDAGIICTADDECEESVTVGPPNHVTGSIAYADRPPAGGEHNPCWGAWGVHDTPLAPERWVHNLEHGGVVFLYRCPDGCPDDVAKLAALVKGRPRTLVTAYPDMKARFAAVAWGVRLLTEKVDLTAYEAFYDAHFDHAFESIDSGPPSGCPE